MNYIDAIMNPPLTNKQNPIEIQVLVAALTRDSRNMIVHCQGVPLGCWPANANGVPLAVVERRFGRVADFHGAIAKIE